jgi:polar amino acid transport system substrate-binding protein
MDISRRAVGTAAIGTIVAASSLATAQRANAQASGDSTFDRVRQTKVLRIAALPGESPYFNKNIATGEWTGMAVEMAKNIATSFDAKLEYLESTYGNSVLDLQSGKIDLAFALNPTPQRALVIGFSRPVFMHGFGTVAKKGSSPRPGATSTSPRSRSRSISARCTSSRPQLRLEGGDHRPQDPRRMRAGGADRDAQTASSWR